MSNETVQALATLKQVVDVAVAKGVFVSADAVVAVQSAYDLIVRLLEAKK